MVLYSVFPNFTGCVYNFNMVDMNITIKSVTFHESGRSTEWYMQVTWSPFTGTYSSVKNFAYLLHDRISNYLLELLFSLE